MIVRLARALALLLAAGAAVACGTGKDPYNPGTPLGVYHVTAKSTSNTCGDANAPPNPWTFDVKLSRDTSTSTLYWIQGGLPVSGKLDASGHTEMTSSDSRTIHDADPRQQIGFCAMSRTDTLEATLAAPDADGGVDGFTGTLVYQFAATDGSDCSDVVLSGTYAALPCEIHLDLSAAR